MRPTRFYWLGIIKLEDIQMHNSDCSSNNNGTPELLGECDCELNAKVQHKYGTYLYRLLRNQVLRMKTMFLSKIGW